jgi:hypothetical protein
MWYNRKLRHGTTAVALSSWAVLCFNRDGAQWSLSDGHFTAVSLLFGALLVRCCVVKLKGKYSCSNCDAKENTALFKRPFFSYISAGFYSASTLKVKRNCHFPAGTECLTVNRYKNFLIRFKYRSIKTIKSTFVFLRGAENPVPVHPHNLYTV